MYITNFREARAVINTTIVMATAEGVVKRYDCNLLKCNGGHIECGKNWAKNFLHHLGYVKKRASTKCKVSVADFDMCKAQFLFHIQTIFEMEEIPHQLVINWDPTGINYVPVSTWTMAKDASKRAEITGIGDKRQLTAAFASTMNGDFFTSSNNLNRENFKMSSFNNISQ